MATESLFDLIEAGKTPVTRIQVIVGEDDDPGRRGDKTVIAFSDCAYFCPDGATLVKCVEHIKSSDDRLRSRPQEQMLWDWKTTWLQHNDPDDPGKGGIVFLGVAWYDREFFDDRKDAWFGRMHQREYQEIGVPMGEVRVQHYLALKYADWKPQTTATQVPELTTADAR
jgi:hypothetical protein